ncbi:hypothetical protein Aau02nite_50280 [Amorphoplanes auranticolor]|uniref:Uncharacterized protein n=1 Tax=Actinoplanes auranticolor TaxID=47988 RepID=A0A919VWZ5_9ACTN|nr:hypothetical protein Aau02nite_50280 [Actinoplanes auranticolor]
MRWAIASKLGWVAGAFSASTRAGSGYAPVATAAYSCSTCAAIRSGSVMPAWAWASSWLT